MRSLAESRTRWEFTFADAPNLSDLRAAVKRGIADSPCTNGLRSVCWKAFLVFENLDQSTWPKTIRDSRGAYASLKEHLLREIKHPDDISALDPLADDITSPWNTLRKDELLRAEIFQDVERCMPENLYFREPETQTMLLDILFIYCKLNLDIGYRQGMHEILAPILWVVSRDAVNLETAEEGSESGENDSLILSTLSAKYIEHDAFTIFGILMQTAKAFYETSSAMPASAGSSSSGSAIVERSQRIHNEYLRKVDPELADHLTAIDILPQIFVIRWIRLLYGREFPFDDVLCLWDVLFAEDPGLSLVDHVCVAMLLRVRWQLLKADYSAALALLLRYPVPEEPYGPVTFIEDALHLRRSMSEEVGARLISKYSGKPPSTRTSKGRPYRTPMHSPRGSEDLSRTRSPLRSPGQILQDSGGIEGLLQEAAKGVYRRSEQWGLGQAFRNAVHGLQSGASTPRRPQSSARWSLDEGRGEIDPRLLGARIQALEDRNKALAKMLQETMADLSAQATNFEEQKQKAAADKLTVSVAKLQYLQIYLENSSLPIGGESASIDNSVQPQTTSDEKAAQQAQSPHPTDAPTTIAAQAQRRWSKSSESGSRSPVRAPVRRPANISTAPPRITTTTAAGSPRSGTPLSSPFQHPRPSLAQSSFSWMLGDEEQHRPSFNTASPFSPERDRDRKIALRGKTGFLFGDDKDDGVGHKGGKERGRAGAEDDDGFTLGTLKGVGRE